MTNLKYISGLIIVIVLLIVGYRFEQYKVEKDFLLFTTIECSEGDTGCFTLECSGDDLECDPTPYKKVVIQADGASSCLFEHDCVDFVCNETENCEIIICDDSSIEEGETCVMNTM